MTAATLDTTTHVTSTDGTTIAFTRQGEGPPLILVDGALCYRGLSGSLKLAELLAGHFTVYSYDRRGKGESGDNPPFAIEREVEDIGALIEHAGGSAYVYGISSGGALALEAANRLPSITKLAVYELPLMVDDTREIPEAYAERLEELVAADRDADALKHFFRAVEMPGFLIALMPVFPGWSKLKGVAHTLTYDAAYVTDHWTGEPLPADRWADVTADTLVIAGGKSPEWMRNAQDNVAAVVPGATLRTLEGQTHMIKPKALAPALIEFFDGGQS